MFAPYFYHYLMVRVIVVSLAQESVVCSVHHGDPFQMGHPRGTTGTSWVKIWAKSGDCHWSEPLADGLVGPDRDRTTAVMQRVYN
jgi:hypothetical protein